jgi:uncharacterized membrane protein YuzA (DUF378 family)
MKTLQIFALTLTIIGAINWGLVGLFNYDLVASLFNGATSTTSRIVYSIIGLAGVINLRLLFELFEKLDDGRK